MARRMTRTNASAQIYTEKKRTDPSVAETRRELGQKTVAEYANQWWTRQRKMPQYSTGEHVDSPLNVHIFPRLGSRKLNTVTPLAIELFPGRIGGGRGRPGESGQQLPRPEDDSAGRL